MGELGVSHQMRYVLARCMNHTAHTPPQTRLPTACASINKNLPPVSLRHSSLPSLILSLSLCCALPCAPVDPFLGKVKRRLFKLGAGGRRWWLVDLSCGHPILKFLTIGLA